MTHRAAIDPGRDQQRRDPDPKPGEVKSQVRERLAVVGRRHPHRRRDVVVCGRPRQFTSEVINQRRKAGRNRPQTSTSKEEEEDAELTKAAVA